MRILLVNPNTDPAATARMLAAARRLVPATTTITAVAAESGLVQCAAAAPAVVQSIAARRGTFDAAIIAAFSDPGLAAARREAAPCPVDGIAAAIRRVMRPAS